MANDLYGLGAKALLDGTFDVSGGLLRLVLVDTVEYTLLIDADDFLADIPAGGIFAESANFAGVTTTAGVFDATDVVLPTVTTSTSTAELVIIFEETGSDATSKLLCAIDTATGLPITPNGGNININWDNGANKIFTL